MLDLQFPDCVGPGQNKFTRPQYIAFMLYFLGRSVVDMQQRRQIIGLTKLLTPSEMASFQRELVAHGAPSVTLNSARQNHQQNQVKKSTLKDVVNERFLEFMEAVNKKRGLYRRGHAAFQSGFAYSSVDLRRSRLYASSEEGFTLVVNFDKEWGDLPGSYQRVRTLETLFQKYTEDVEWKEKNFFNVTGNEITITRGVSVSFGGSIELELQTEYDALGMLLALSTEGRTGEGWNQANFRARYEPSPDHSSLVRKNQYFNSDASTLIARLEDVAPERISFNPAANGFAPTFKMKGQSFAVYVPTFRSYREEIETILPIAV